MLFVALAGLSGLVWGVGDFAGGKATQRADALPVVWLSKLISLPLLALYLVLLPARSTAAASRGERSRERSGRSASSSSTARSPRAP